MTARRLASLFALVAIAVASFVLIEKSPKVATTRALAASTRATTSVAPSTTEAVPTVVVRTWHDVVSAKKLHAATQPLEIPTSFDRAAKLVVDFPVVVDSRGDLWVTDPAAAPFAQTMKTIDDEQTHVVAEPIASAEWVVDRKKQSVPFVRFQKVGDAAPPPRIGNRIATELSVPSERATLSAWDDRLIMKMAGVVGVLLADSDSFKADVAIFAADGKPSEDDVQILRDNRGLLAWRPSADEPPQRFVDDVWHKLSPADGWSTHVLQLVPLLDGSVIQLAFDDSHNVVTTVIQLDPPTTQPDGGEATVDQAAVMKVVARLSDADPSIREAAFDELSRFGAGVLPLLAKIKDDQPAEAQLRIEQLLAGQLRPLLGAMMIEPGPAKVVAHLADGGSVIKFDAGVVFPAVGDRSAQPIAPAYIVFRPGRAVKLLPPAIVERLELKPETKFQAFNDEWVISDDAVGPLRLIGSQLMPMLAKEYASFNQLVAFDRRGRWLFHDVAQPGKTLIVDPTYVDETPVLPAWEILAGTGTVGWTRDNWPCIQNGGTWALKEDGWQAIKEPPITELPVDPPVATTTTSPSTTTAPAETAIWTDTDGTQFFGGETDLRMTSQTGQTVTWPLPDGTAGAASVHLFRAGENRLFLYNAPGRLVRIKQHAPGNAQPFEVEAAFADGIPPDVPTRVWLDPAGRIVFAVPGRIAVLFPTGTIPPGIAKMITFRAK